MNYTEALAIWKSIFRHIGYCPTWDWPTLWVCYPQMARKLRELQPIVFPRKATS